MSRVPDTAPGKALRRPLLVGAALALLLYGVFGMLDLFDAWQVRRAESLKRNLRLELDRETLLARYQARAAREASRGRG